MARKRTEREKLAFFALDDFTGWVTGRDPDAPVTAGDFAALVAEYEEAGFPRVAADYDDMIDDVVNRRQRRAWQLARSHAFERVLVKRIAHLFPNHGELCEDGRHISRRILPGLFQAVIMMLGHDDLAAHRKECQDILQNLRDPETDEFDWDRLYADKRANDLVDDVLAQGLGYLDDARKRMDWFRRLVNSHLAPAETFLFEGEKAAVWVIDEVGSVDVLSSLFKRLHERSEDADERALLDSEYGAVNIDKLRQFYEGLGELRQSLPA